jgi:chaperonin GroEL
MSTTLNDVLVLILDKKITQVKELLPILESVSAQNKSLLIVAEDIEGEALSNFDCKQSKRYLKSMQLLKLLTLVIVVN